MSCNCCCNFCISLLDVSRLPLFINIASLGTVLEINGAGSSSASALTSDIVPVIKINNEKY